MDKNQIRKQCLKARAGITPANAQIASRMVITHVMSLLNRGQTVAGYCAIRDELDISTLLKVLAERGHAICLPVVSQKESALTFRQWQPGDALVKGSYNIPIPPENAASLTPDLVMVPVVAFDKQCHRLGYGAGYYDRTLQYLRKHNPKTIAVGLAYAMQQVNGFPVERHDEKLDVIITENGVIRAA